MKINSVLWEFRRITVHSNGTLQVNNIQASDQGLYNCVGIKGESKEVPQSYTAELHLASTFNSIIFYFQDLLFYNIFVLTGMSL